MLIKYTMFNNDNFHFCWLIVTYKLKCPGHTQEVIRVQQNI